MLRLAPDHRFINTNGITLHVATTGPEDGPLVILLHGFPEFWFGWRHQMHALEDAGFRVWVPDQRGYNLSDKPRGYKAYQLDELAADIVGLIDAAGVEKAFVAGHDWGAMVAWWLGIHHSDRLHKLAILNVPHLASYAAFLKKHPSQLLKSWYVAFFQLPVLPEIGFRLFMQRALRSSAHPTTFSKGDLAAYTNAWKQRHAVRSMLNWYRAIFRMRKYRKLSDGRVTVPTQILWGEQDIALDKRLAKASLDWCDDGNVVYFPKATHWVQHDASEDVTRLLIEHFSD